MAGPVAFETGVRSRKNPGAERVKAPGHSEISLPLPRRNFALGPRRRAGLLLLALSHTRAAAVMGSGPGSPLRTGACTRKCPSAASTRLGLQLGERADVVDLALFIERRDRFGARRFPAAPASPRVYSLTAPGGAAPPLLRLSSRPRRGLAGGSIRGSLRPASARRGGRSAPTRAHRPCQVKTLRSYGRSPS
jgi:hypothetical protein